jgi:transcriptional regulator with XRE-family HTH domain
MPSAASLIRSARAHAGLTQAELAGRLGVTQAAIAKLERQRANPRVETLAAALSAAGHRLELHAAPRPSSVDETLIASYLRLSPQERLRMFESSHSSLAKLRGRARSDDA